MQEQPEDINDFKIIFFEESGVNFAEAMNNNYFDVRKEELLSYLEGNQGNPESLNEIIEK